MASGSLARRYARALIGLGQEKDLMDLFAQELSAFHAVLEQNDGQLASALNNPGLTLTERKALVSAILAKLSLNTLTNNFIHLLMEKNRLLLFGNICQAYQEMADEVAGRVRASVTTAQALNKTNTKKIEGVLCKATGKTVLVDFHVDPDLIGGIVARVGDVVYDASIQSRLRDLHDELSR